MTQSSLRRKVRQPIKYYWTTPVGDPASTNGIKWAICISTMSSSQLWRNSEYNFQQKTSPTSGPWAKILRIWFPFSWLRVDFTPMREPCLGYEEQNYINPHCAEIVSAAMIHFGLDPGKCVCFLAGEYTGHHWDANCTLNAVQDYVTLDDYEHMC